jgi:hypothetical protein
MRIYTFCGILNYDPVSLDSKFCAYYDGCWTSNSSDDVTHMVLKSPWMKVKLKVKLSLGLTEYHAMKTSCTSPGTMA